MAQICNAGLFFTGTHPFNKVFTPRGLNPPKFTCFPSYIGPEYPYLPQVAFYCTPPALGFSARGVGQSGPPPPPAASHESARFGSFDLSQDGPASARSPPLSASGGLPSGPLPKTATPLMTAQVRAHSTAFYPQSDRSHLKSPARFLAGEVTANESTEEGAWILPGRCIAHDVPSG